MLSTCLGPAQACVFYIAYAAFFQVLPLACKLARGERENGANLYEGGIVM